MQYEVNGALLSDNGIPDRLQVTAVELTSPLSQTTAFVNHDGTFEIRSLPAGSYEFRLATIHGDVLAKQLVSVPSITVVRFNLNGLTGVNAQDAGPVSYYRLSHQVPGKAWKFWQKAAKAARDNHPEEAMAFLDKALAEDPQFADALHMRGVYALQDREFEKARELLGRAVALDQSNPSFLADAAYGLYVSESTNQAQSYARSALRLDPANKKANYILALTMLRQGNQGEETVRALRQASPLFPSAARILNQLHNPCPQR